MLAGYNTDVVVTTARGRQIALYIRTHCDGLNSSDIIADFLVLITFQSGTYDQCSLQNNDSLFVHLLLPCALVLIIISVHTVLFCMFHLPNSLIASIRAPTGGRFRSFEQELRTSLFLLLQ